MAISPGTRLGPYEVLSPLGAGGMGEVYRAKDTRLGRDVALKILPESVALDAEALARFEREARAVAALSHPNILSIFDFGREGDVSYAVMELLEGESLLARLRQGPLSSRRASELAIQMAEGLAAAHEKRVVHRDLKPGNLWITTEGRLKILDFGLAKKVQGGPSAMDTALPTEEGPADHQTRQGAVLGTMGYMSPEQVRGEGVDARSDIFSFGVVLYEMLTGKRAFARATTADTMSAILKEDPPEIEETGRPVSPGLRRIVERCLEKAPGRRFQTALDLAFALENAAGTPSGASGPAALRAFGAGPLRRALTVAAVLLAAGLVFFGGWFARPGRSAQPRFTQVTYSEENARAARFTHDGRSVVFTSGFASTSRVLVQNLDNAISRPVLESSATLLSLSSADELAVNFRPGGGENSLGICPLGGAQPRVLSKNVSGADWAPDGKTLAVARVTASGGQLEYPEGKVLASIERGSFRNPRFSPDGKQIAVARLRNDDFASVLVVDVATGRTRELGGSWTLVVGLAWRPDGRELWFSANRTTYAYEIFGVDLKGNVRTILSAPVGLNLQDVAPDGRVLVTSGQRRHDAFAQEAGSAKARRLTIRRQSFARDLSADNRLALLLDTTTCSEANCPLFLKPTDGSLPIPVGEGIRGWIAPDGKSLLVERKAGGRNVYLFVPVAGGAEKPLQTEALAIRTISWSPKHGVLALATNGQDPPRIWKIGSDAPPEAVGPPLPRDAFGLLLPRPDAREALVGIKDGPCLWTDLEDPASPPRESPASWPTLESWWPSRDGTSCFAVRGGTSPAAVERVNLLSGRREPFRQLEFPGTNSFLFKSIGSEDGGMMLLGVFTDASELFVVEGLK